MQRNCPEPLRNLMMTANEKRHAAQRLGLPVPDGLTFGQLPLVKLDQQVWGPLFTVFARKLALALHYHAFLAPMPRSGGIWIDVKTNADFIAGKLDQEFMEMANRLVRPSRNKSYLDDQLLIRWDVNAEIGAAVFHTSIQNRLVFSALTANDADKIRGRDDVMLTPF